MKFLTMILFVEICQSEILRPSHHRVLEGFLSAILPSEEQMRVDEFKEDIKQKFQEDLMKTMNLRQIEMLTEKNISNMFDKLKQNHKLTLTKFGEAKDLLNEEIDKITSSSNH